MSLFLSVQFGKVTHLHQERYSWTSTEILKTETTKQKEWLCQIEFQREHLGGKSALFPGLPWQHHWQYEIRDGGNTVRVPVCYHPDVWSYCFSHLRFIKSILMIHLLLQLDKFAFLIGMWVWVLWSWTEDEPPLLMVGAQVCARSYSLCRGSRQLKG